jgi:hypothetical protein
LHHEGEKEVDLKGLMAKLDPQQTCLFEVIAKLKELEKMVRQSDSESNRYLLNCEEGTNENDAFKEVDPSKVMIDNLVLVIVSKFSLFDKDMFGEEICGWTIEDLMHLARRNDLDDIYNQWKVKMKMKREEWMTKWSNKMKFIRQRQYADDAKRLFNWLIKGNTLMSETLPSDLFELFNDRRKNNDTINEEAGRSTLVLRQQ